MTKALRPGKVLLDWSQNHPAKTTISPYSLRGRELPTVAAPRTLGRARGGRAGAADPRRGGPAAGRRTATSWPPCSRRGPRLPGLNSPRSFRQAALQEPALGLVRRGVERAGVLGAGLARALPSRRSRSARVEWK